MERDLIEQRTTITLEAARIALAGCRQHCDEIGVSMSTAVVDPAGHLLAFERYGDALLVAGNKVAVQPFGVPPRLFISGWMRVPKASTPSTKSSNVSSTPPVFGTSAISSSMRATLS